MAKKSKTGEADAAKPDAETVSDAVEEAAESAISTASEAVEAAHDAAEEVAEDAVELLSDAEGNTESATIDLDKPGDDIESMSVDVDGLDTPEDAEADGAAEFDESEAQPDPEPVEASADTAPVPPPPAAPPKRRGMGVLLGGLLSAGIGAGALYFVQEQGWLNLGGPDPELIARLDTLEGELTAAREAVSAAEAEITALKEAEPDLSPLTSALEEVKAASETGIATLTETTSGNTEALAGLTTRLDDTDARLNTLAVEQIPEAELPAKISEAYDAKLADLLGTIDGRFETMQGAMTERFTEMETSFTAKLTEIEQAEAEAEAAVAEAEEAARNSVALAGLATLQTALEDGSSFADALGQIADNSAVTIPEALSSVAESGVPTVAMLTETFAPYARSALTESAKLATEEGTMTGFEAFMRSQVGARSLEPREGDGPDAVLSRAEAAVAGGDIDAAMVELEGLPEAGKAELADWVAQVETRRAALEAATALAAELNNN